MDLMLAMFAKGGASKLASLPQVLLRLLEAYDGGRAQSAQLADVIATDPALCAKILEIASTDAGPGCCDKLDLRGALTAVSAESVKSIVIGASGHPMLLRHGGKWLAHLEKLWLRSLTCAMTARALAELTEYDAPEEAYLAGLLHNIGQLALGAYAPDQYPNLLSVAREGAKLTQLELSHFNTDHYEVGAALAESWNLQSFLGDAIRYQSEPAEALRDAHPLVRLVHLARALGAPAKEDRERAATAAETLFPYVPVKRILALADDANDQVGEAALALGVRLDQDGDRSGVAEKTFELATRVRNIAILDGVSQPLGGLRDEHALVESVRHGVEILVGSSDGCVLLYDADTDTLAGAGLAARHRLLRELRLPVGPGRNVPGRALAEGRISHSADAEAEQMLGVADRQLLRLLNAEAMLCVPLLADETRIGVIVLGVDKTELPYPQERLMLLGQFAQRAAAAIAAARDSAVEAPVGIGDSKRLEQRVHQSVHEARNPLTTVKNYVQILSNKNADEEWAKRDLKIIGEEIERVEQILRELADFSQEKTSPQQPVAINQVIRDLVWILQASILDAHQIEADLDLGDDLPLLPVRADGIKQIVANLVNNACEAMRDGGKITIRTRANIATEDGLHVELSVSDQGPGIAPELMPRLFEGGATDKGDGHGIGLAIIREMVGEWGGSISCRSEPGAGATFQILLPYPAEAESAE